METASGITVLRASCPGSGVHNRTPIPEANRYVVLPNQVNNRSVHGVSDDHDDGEPQKRHMRCVGAVPPNSIGLWPVRIGRWPHAAGVPRTGDSTDSGDGAPGSASRGAGKHSGRANRISGRG